MKYNKLDKVLYNLKKLLGSGVGLATPFIGSGSDNASNINLFIQQLNIPAYHKVFFGVSNNSKYHIAGYGQSYEESLTRVLGETVERYSFMSLHHLFSNKIVTESFVNLRKDNKVLPLEYLNVIDVNNPKFHHVKEDEKIEWIRLRNLVDNEDMFFPYIFLTINHMKDNFILPTMSTGTATHMTYEQAISNAITEAVQINGFMEAWYGVKQLPVVDWEPYVSDAFKKILKKTFKKIDDIEIIVLDNSSKDFNLPCYVTIIKNKKHAFPYYAIGIQAGLNSEYALLRSMMESAAIYVNLQEFLIELLERVNTLSVSDVKSSYNLDDTYIYWASSNELILKQEVLSNFISKEVIPFKLTSEMTSKNEVKNLLQSSVKNLKYFSIIDITPPELIPFGYKTVRIIAPELLPMCFPALPYAEHPFFKSTGGIKNANFPHPLP